jgi:hypothetical protein
MNKLQRVVKGVFTIDIIGSIAFLILILGYIGLTNLQRNQIPSDPGISTTTQQ